MALKFRRQAVAVAIESGGYGVDAEPTFAANVIMCSDIEFNPLVANTVNRRLLYGDLSAVPVKHVGMHQTIRFASELAGSGAAGTAPKWDVLARICALAATETPGVDVAYEPVSEDEESGTLYFERDTILHKMTGARGSARLVFPANDLAHVVYTLTGLMVPAESTTFANPSFGGWQEALEVNKANTPTFTLHGFAAVMQSLEIDLGNTVVHRDRVNSEEVKRPNREITGRVTFECPDLATKNYFASVKEHTLDALQLVHGTTAGNVIQVDAPKVQLANPSYADDEGILMLSMDLRFTRDQGDDELKITVK